MGTVYFTGASREAGRRQAAFDEILERLRSVPGVSAAGAGSTAPFARLTTLSRITIPDADGRPVAIGTGMPAVTPG
jgi:hypothetical protein